MSPDKPDTPDTASDKPDATPDKPDATSDEANAASDKTDAHAETERALDASATNSAPETTATHGASAAAKLQQAPLFDPPKAEASSDAASETRTADKPSVADPPSVSESRTADVPADKAKAADSKDKPPEGPDIWDRAFEWLPEHGAIPALIVLTLAVGAIFIRVFWGETIGDDLTFHMSESARLADCIRTGDWDLWNPSANAGFASAYYYQVIPQLVSALPAAAFGHHLFWFQLSLWLPLVLAPPAAYRGARLLGATPWQSVAAATAVAFISGASRWGGGADGTFQVGLYTQTWALCAFPLGLGYGVRWLLHGKGIGASIAWGAFVFLCHPFAGISLCLALAVGVLAHYLRLPVRNPYLQIVIGSLALCGALICAFQVVASLPGDPENPVKVLYIAPLVFTAGVAARTVLRGRWLALALLVVVVVAFVINLYMFGNDIVPPDAKNPGGRRPLYIAPIMLLAGLAGRFLWDIFYPPKPRRIADDDAAETTATAGVPDDAVFEHTWRVPAAIGSFALAGVFLLAFIATEAPAFAVLVLPFSVGGGLVAWQVPRTPQSDRWQLMCLAGLIGIVMALALGFLSTKSKVFVAAALPVAGAAVWLGWRFRREPLVRLVLLGAGLLVATIPGWATLIFDGDGFGGFPHRVSDEVGPGYKELMNWHAHGTVLDYGRVVILTWSLPLVLFLGRGGIFRWLWAPALLFATLLAVGPHAPKTADDLLPAVRFLGALQVVLAMGIGIGLYRIAEILWFAEEGSLAALAGKVVISFAVGVLGVGFVAYLWLGADDSRGINIVYRLTLQQVEDLKTLRIVGTALVGAIAPAIIVYAWKPMGTQFGLRTGIAAGGAAVTAVLTVMGANALQNRVHVLEEYGYRQEMMDIIALLEKQPPGRKQVGPGCENHWWNMLSYVYGRRPSLLQMGGGGLQASPNYDFLWSVRDFPKLAWVYDTPYFLFQRSNSANVPEGEVVGHTEKYEVRKFAAPGIVSPIQITGVLPAGPIRAESPTRKAAIEWLRSDIAYQDHMLVYDGFGGAGPAPDATVLRAWRQDSPGDEADIVAEVDVRQPSTFVARESWHPRWHAFVDGVEVPVRRVTPDFPAIDVPPGHHDLAFRFERPWWAHAAWLAWPGAAIAAWLLARLFSKYGAKRATQPSIA